MDGKIIILIVFGVFAVGVVGATAVFFGRILWARRNPAALAEFERRESEAARRERIVRNERRGKASWAGRFFGAVFTLIGIGFACYVGWQIYEIGRGQFWTRAKCDILSSSVGRTQSGSTRPANTFSPAVKYSYSFDGREFTGSRVDLPNNYYFSSDAARLAIAVYPAGASVACYVNSANPQESVLDRSFLRFPFFNNGLGLLLTFGLGGFLLYASRRRKPKIRG